MYTYIHTYIYIYMYTYVYYIYIYVCDAPPPLRRSRECLGHRRRYSTTGISIC